MHHNPWMNAALIAFIVLCMVALTYLFNRSPEHRAADRKRLRRRRG
jgi:hypothetical protein